jgi:hypothetical protein
MREASVKVSSCAETTHAAAGVRGPRAVLRVRGVVRSVRRPVPVVRRRVAVRRVPVRRRRVVVRGPVRRAVARVSVLAACVARVLLAGTRGLVLVLARVRRVLPVLRCGRVAVLRRRGVSVRRRRGAAVLRGRGTAVPRGRGVAVLRLGARAVLLRRLVLLCTAGVGLLRGRGTLVLRGVLGLLRGLGVVVLSVCLARGKRVSSAATHGAAFPLTLLPDVLCAESARPCSRSPLFMDRLPVRTAWSWSMPRRRSSATTTASASSCLAAAAPASVVPCAAESATRADSVRAATNAPE